MILSLRRRHRRMFAVLGILLPAALVASVAGRKPIPTATLPEAALSAAATYSVSQWDRGDLFSGTPVRAELLHEASNPDRSAIRLSAPKDFVKADLLVYWVPAESVATNVIPDDAILLGAFISGNPLPMPPGLVGKPGSLVLYSLADQDLVGNSQPFSQR